MAKQWNYERLADEGNIEAFTYHDDRYIPEDQRKWNSQLLRRINWSSLKAYLVVKFPEVIAELPRSKTEALEMGLKVYNSGAVCIKHGHAVRRVHKREGKVGECISCAHDYRVRNVGVKRKLFEADAALKGALRSQAREVAKSKGWSKPRGFTELTSGIITEADLFDTREGAAAAGHLIYRCVPSRGPRKGQQLIANFKGITQEASRRISANQRHRVNREGCLKSDRKRNRKFFATDHGKAVGLRGNALQRARALLSPVIDPKLKLVIPPNTYCPLTGWSSEFDYTGKGSPWHHDHIIPASLGGHHTKANLRPVFGKANSSKKDKLPLTVLHWTVEDTIVKEEIHFDPTVRGWEFILDNYGPEVREEDRGPSYKRNLRRQLQVIKAVVAENTQRKRLAKLVANADSDTRNRFRKRVETIRSHYGQGKNWCGEYMANEVPIAELKEAWRLSKR